jgi:hypothetical protein
MVGKNLITFCCLSFSCSSFSRNTLRSMICGIQEQPLHLRSLSGFSNLSRPELRCNVMCYSLRSEITVEDLVQTLYLPDDQTWRDPPHERRYEARHRMVQWDL